MASSSSHFLPRDKLPTVIHNLGDETAVGPQDNALAKADVIPGKLLQYQVERKLGQGGMGWVLLAEDTKLHRKVALKVMRGRLASDKASCERFLREARAAAALRHDNVITIYQVDEDRGVPFFAMELLEGGTLQQRLEYPKPLSLGAALRIAREIAQGLQAAHERGVIHRDIKPANIWLESPKGRVKILDFGLARHLDVQSGLTHAGEIVGTPHYMSPEQARGKTIDARTDLFSLGCILYRTITGKLPFAGETLLATLTSIAVDTPAPVCKLNPQVPHPLGDLIERLLAKDPAQRPASAGEVIEELLAIERDLAPGNRSGSYIDVPAAVLVQIRPKSAPVGPGTSPLPAPLESLTTSVSSVFRRPSAASAPRRALPPHQLPWLIGGAGAAILVPALLLIAWMSGMLRAGAPERHTAPPSAPQPTTPENHKSAISQPQPSPAATTPRPSGVDLRGVIPLQASASHSKAAAEWALASGGPTTSVQVQLVGQTNTIKISDAAQLPADPYVLVVVEFGGSKTLRDSELQNLSGVTTLRWLDLASTSISDAGLADLVDLPALTNLKLSRTNISDVSLAKIAATAPLLERLQIGETNCTAGAMAHIVRLPHLEELSLAGLPIGNGDLALVAKLQRLKILDLQGTQITAPGLRHLDALPELTNLVLDETVVGNEGLATVAKWGRLELLKLNRTDITNAGLAQLLHLTRLTYLEIKDNPRLSDDALKELAQIRSLEQLFVTNGQFSQRARREFSRTLPNCRLMLMNSDAP